MCFFLFEATEIKKILRATTKQIKKKRKEIRIDENLDKREIEMREFGAKRELLVIKEMEK